MKRVALIAGAALALLAGIVAIAAAGAQESTPSLQPETQSVVERWVQKVAAGLGVSEDDLTAAMVAANMELVDEAVAEGLLTEEQGDLIKRRIEEKQILFPRMHRDHPPRHRIVKGAMLITGAAAEALDMEKEQLIAEVRSGKSLLEVALENGFREEQFKADLLGEAQATLDELVAEGKIAEEQATRIFESISANIDRIINFVPSGEGRGRPQFAPPGRPGAPLGSGVPLER